MPRRKDNLVAKNEDVKRFRNKNREAGVCTDCGDPVFKTSILCAFHLLSARFRYRKAYGSKPHRHSAKRLPPSHGITKYVPDDELLIIASGLQ